MSKNALNYEKCKISLFSKGYVKMGYYCYLGSTYCIFYFIIILFYMFKMSEIEFIVERNGT